MGNRFLSFHLASGKAGRIKATRMEIKDGRSFFQMLRHIPISTIHSECWSLFHVLRHIPLSTIHFITMAYIHCSHPCTCAANLASSDVPQHCKFFMFTIVLQQSTETTTFPEYNGLVTKLSGGLDHPQRAEYQPTHIRPTHVQST